MSLTITIPAQVRYVNEVTADPQPAAVVQATPGSVTVTDATPQASPTVTL